jgi:hypothetical protein
LISHDFILIALFLPTPVKLYVLIRLPPLPETTPVLLSHPKRHSKTESPRELEAGLLFDIAPLNIALD